VQDQLPIVVGDETGDATVFPVRRAAIRMPKPASTRWRPMSNSLASSPDLRRITARSGNACFRIHSSGRVETYGRVLKCPCAVHRRGLWTGFGILRGEITAFEGPGRLPKANPAQLVNGLVMLYEADPLST
jgi:hypothetical protein